MHEAVTLHYIFKYARTFIFIFSLYGKSHNKIPRTLKYFIAINRQQHACAAYILSICTARTSYIFYAKKNDKYPKINHVNMCLCLCVCHNLFLTSTNFLWKHFWQPKRMVLFLLRAAQKRGKKYISICMKKKMSLG